jgi:xeroderma pigmentosum group C-complementing protein
LLDKENLAASRPLLTPPVSTRAAPKRKAARKSDAQIKSYLFAKGSNSETNLTDITGRASLKKATRGAKSAKGRGRGRGRGKGKA